MHIIIIIIIIIIITNLRAGFVWEMYEAERDSSWA